jgi:cell division protein FtsQ
MSISRVRQQYYGIGFSIKTIIKWFVFSLLLVLFLLGMTKLKNVEYFPIKSVAVIGAHHLDHQAVQALIAPLVSNGFFAADVDRVKERLQQLVWVDQVAVRRLWPDQINVVITEKNPIAIWNNASLLSSNGDLFSPAVDSYPAGLPQLIGPAGEQILMSQYYSKFSEILLPLHFKIARLELTPAMSWRLICDNGIKINIGHKDVLTRIRHFVKVYPKIVGTRAALVEYIDLRYPNGMAVRWKSVI